MPLSNIDTALAFSSQCAAALGVEEAILLPLLQQAQSFSQKNPAEVACVSLLSQLPFWNAHDIQRISKSLADKGVLQIHSPPFSQCQVFQFSFDQQAQANHAANTAPNNVPQHTTPIKAQGANRLSPQFKPDRSCQAQLKQQGIPLSFARQQLPEFINYWTERGEVSHAWNSKFLQHVNHQWQRNKAELPFAISSETVSMSKQWQPSQDAIEILQNIGIPNDFIGDCVPEFILYWQERGDSTNTWNSKLIQHVKRQWAKYTHTLKHDTEPKPIANSWQPKPEVFDLIAMANIDQVFARELIHEFVLYWKESNQLHNSWNSKFLQHVKYRWAQQHQLQGFNHAGQQNTSRSGAAAGSFVATHTDTSWAEGI